MWKITDRTKVVLLTSILKMTGLWDRGYRNALNIQLRRQKIVIPDSFPHLEGMRILFMSDLHLGKIPGLAEKIIAQISDLEVDLCLLGGDYIFHHTMPTDSCIEEMKVIVSTINSRLGIFGVLGNHDSIEMVPKLESIGIRMLMNESVDLKINSKNLQLVGVEDSHFHNRHDLRKAFEYVDTNSFVLFLSHSPELYLEAQEMAADFYLCGHTHGGQICFPKYGAVLTNCNVPREIISGEWKFRNMRGYTGPGVGSSLLPIRFCCIPEVTLITLKNS